MVDLDVRAEEPADASAIGRVVTEAFESPAEARLVEAIRASSDFIEGLSLVAAVDGEIVGHVMISHVGLVTSSGARKVASLSPLAVAPDHQRRGVGSALVRAALERADDRGEPLVVLEGSPDYYGRLGFEPAATYGITIDLPSWAPAEAAQVVRLTRYDPTFRGHVVYPVAFDLVSHD